MNQVNRKEYMRKLPRPPEPSTEKLQKYGNAYDESLQEFWNKDKIKEEAVAKQGIIEYLSRQWEDYTLSRQEIASACGAANTPIEGWYNDKKEWDEVLDRLQSSLAVELE